MHGGLGRIVSGQKRGTKRALHADVAMDRLHTKSGWRARILIFIGLGVWHGHGGEPARGCSGDCDEADLLSRVGMTVRFPPIDHHTCSLAWASPSACDYKRACWIVDLDRPANPVQIGGDAHPRCSIEKFGEAEVCHPNFVPCRSCETEAAGTDLPYLPPLPLATCSKGSSQAVQTMRSGLQAGWDFAS